MLVTLISGLSLYARNRQGVLSKNQLLVDPYMIKGAPGRWDGAPCILGEGKDLAKTIQIDKCILGDFMTAKCRILVIGNSFSASFTSASDELV
jgi:hypothetical protein